MLDKILLFPYYAVLSLRKRMYDKGSRKSVEAPVPTICVGNVTVGGTGKTPHTEMILSALLESDEWGGKQLAMLSRGYGRESRGFQQVSLDSSAAMCGDEPLQIKKKLPSVVVAVCKDRVKGSRFLADPEALQADRKEARKCWNKDFPKSELIVLDDAFQYRALKYSRTIVLVDYNRPVFKDMLLPLGRLRDLPGRIAEADVIIVTKCPSELDDYQRTLTVESMRLGSYDPFSCTARTASGREITVLFSRMEYQPFEPVFPSSDARYVYSKRVILFTGIASPRPLVRYLSDSYKVVSTFSFPDHHKFRSGDWRRIRRAARRWPTALIVTTEKDAQRVLDYNSLPPELKGRMFMLPIKAEFLSDQEREAFRSKIIL